MPLRHAILIARTRIFLPGLAPSCFSYFSPDDNMPNLRSMSDWNPFLR